jgi:hypothetical protein
MTTVYSAVWRVTHDNKQQLHADGEALSRAAREERAALQLQSQHVQQSELKQQVGFTTVTIQDYTQVLKAR